MKYNVQVSIEPGPGVDTAAIGGVLTYLLENSVKTVPGVTQVAIESVVAESVDPDPAVMPPEVSP